MPTTPANVDVLRQGLDSALATVIDPEIRRPITELKMVRSIEIQESEAGTTALIGIDLTTPSCPMKGDIVNLVTQAAESVPGVDNVRIELGSMNAQQREELRVMLRGSATPVIPFTQPGNLTKIYAIGSGKGGVGKSTVTANLAAAMAKNGVKVGVLDADIYGFSIPRMLGVEGQPTRVDSMLLPPISHEVKVVSIGMFVPPGQPVVWRGPMLHRALEQFLTDVYWGDLDVLLLDLPPGTGDIAISVAQLLPNSSILTVTTPQVAAAEVAERSGSIALQTGQKLAGVVENMAWLEQPDGSKLEIFGSGGGEAVSASLSKMTGTDVPLIGQIPLDIDLRADGDAGVPVVLAHPESPAAKALTEIALSLAHSERGLSGLRLNITPL
ncbi:Mrp/NBP35 family ATP-binding protein [Timonella senegalensis]|uniref:Mrp/NBP35 family ATP-binding protein n=1 Tax=Timonella senegalensis TaxID=1465825 RepID=UPI0002DE44A5|nr:P-loop NTPase [Timonella senegalensis]